MLGEREGLVAVEPETPEPGPARRWLVLGSCLAVFAVFAVWWLAVYGALVLVGVL